MWRLDVMHKLQKKELENIGEIDLVLGNNEKVDIVKYVEKYIKEKRKAGRNRRCNAKPENFMILEKLHLQKKREQL